MSKILLWKVVTFLLNGRKILERRKYASIVENRMEDEGYTIETALRDNAKILEQCQIYKVNYIFIDDKYQIDIEL